MKHHEKRLFAHVVSMIAIPDGGDMSDGIDFLLSEDLNANMAEAKRRVDVMITSIMGASDNPYGSDREAICQEIMRRVEGD